MAKRRAVERARPPSSWMHSRGWVVLASIACVSLLAACPIDSRRLQVAAAAGGQAGSGTIRPGAAGRGSAGTEQSVGGADAGFDSAGSPSAGLGGEGGQPEPTVDGCADLDMNGIADCQETLVKNPDFAQD